MKKFMYVALMALTLGFMASCSGGSSASSDKYADGKEPSIDWNKGTVNGDSFDNTTEKCWKMHFTTTVNGYSSSYDQWVFGTEFQVVSTGELWLAEMAHIGNNKSTYSYKESGEKDYESCMGNNKDEK